MSPDQFIADLRARNARYRVQFNAAAEATLAAVAEYAASAARIRAATPAPFAETMLEPLREHLDDLESLRDRVALACDRLRDALGVAS